MSDVVSLERDVSQHGEQPILLDYFYRRSKPVHKILVDVGAFGKQFSNTWALLCREGWRGVLIEADPERFEIVKKDFATKKVVILNVAAGWEDKEIDFHLHSELGHNSFIENWYPQDDTGKTIKIRTRPLADILKENGIPWDFDLLSVDTEGFDEVIMMKLFQSEYRPRVIVTECTSYANADGLFGDAGYKFLTKTGNPEYGNYIYIRSES